MSAFRISLGVAISFLILMITFILLRKLVPSDIIFYQGLELILVFSSFGIISSFFLLKIGRINRNSFDEKVFIVIITTLLFYCVHITVPSLLDRSISLYIIGVSQKKANNNIIDYREQFYKGFIVRNRAIEKRLNEQVVTGNIECKDGRCNLTDKGKLVYKLNVWIAKIFNVDDKYVSPLIY